MRAVSARVAVFAVAIVLAVAIAGDLLRMPVQVSDSVGEILDALRSPSIADSLVAGIHNEAYLRPLRLAQIKALSDLAQERHYWLVYRSFHALLLVVAIVLFARALRVKTPVDAGAAAFALAVLVGLHTFRGLIQEAFPINHFLEIVVLCLLTLNLAQSRGGLLVDAAAILTFTAAALTLESGLLVWVVATAAWATGWRGISGRGIAAMSVVLAGYLCLRFLYLETGVPTLLERSSGYLLTRLDPPELQGRFAAEPLWFYAYNVATSAVSVLFSEPRAGVFVAVRAWLDQALLPRVVIPLVTSIATTGLIGWAALRRMRRRPLPDDTSRMLVIFAAVLIANAALSFAYTKDEIVSVAGAFYAIAAFAAMRDFLARVPHIGATAAVAAGIFALTLTVGWTVRAAGMHYLVRSQAFKNQNEWAGLPYAWQRSGRWPDDSPAQQAVLRLHAEAVAMQVPNTRIALPRWIDRWWEE